MEPSFETVSRSGFRRTMALKLLALFAGAVLGIAFIVAVAQPDLLRGVGSGWQARLALSGVRTVEGAFESRSVYEYGLFDRRPVPLAHPGRLVDYDRSGAHEAVLAFFEETRDVAAVVLGPEPTTLAASHTVKSSVTIAPDGRTVAYAELIQADEGAAFASMDAYFDPDRWVIKTVDVGTGAVTTQGVGYAPRLFTYQGAPYVLFTNGIGIRIMSLGETGDRVDVVHVFSTSGRQPAEISDDGSHLALFDASIGTYRIFRVTGIGQTVALEELFRYPGFHRVAFDGARAVVALPVYESGTVSYSLGSLDLESQKSAVPAVRVLTGMLPNKLIP